jgi:hypothetical protein
LRTLVNASRKSGEVHKNTGLVARQKERLCKVAQPCEFDLKGAQMCTPLEVFLSNFDRYMREIMCSSDKRKGCAKLHTLGHVIFQKGDYSR